MQKIKMFLKLKAHDWIEPEHLPTQKKNIYTLVSRASYSCQRLTPTFQGAGKNRKNSENEGVLDLGQWFFPRTWLNQASLLYLSLYSSRFTPKISVI